MAGPAVAPPQTLAPSPRRHDDGKQPPSRGAQEASITAASSSSCSSASSSASSSSSAAGRAPLPNKQPKPIAATRPAAAAAAAAAALPRLSLPPVDKMAMAAVVSPNPATEPPKLSMTSKEWVIPPRPKPGRKPATDTPPTKRKAQNRAAQRAFRERRAARVGELEQQLDEQREAHDQREAELKDKIHGLELDLQSFRSRCVLLENMLDRERQERIRAETQAETLKRQQSDDFYFRAPPMAAAAAASHRHASPQHHAASRPPPRHDQRPTPHAAGRSLSISHIITPHDALGLAPPQQHDDAADVPPALTTCGNCSPAGPCACADEALASAAAGCGSCGFGAPCQCLEEVAGPPLKRPPSPSCLASGGKRQRFGGAALEIETNFTGAFSGADDPHQSVFAMGQMPSADAMPLKDRCGFCKEGTYCMCAEEAAMATPAMTPTAEALPPLSHQTQTPPPSEPDIVAPPPLIMEMTADGAVKLPPRRTTLPPRPHRKPTKTSSGCGANGPGTCAQCQADPKSGLFCRLMAAKFDRDQSGGGCCGGKGADGAGGCCKSRPAAAATAERITLPSLPSLGLSCAEAYQTLSSHRNFDRAADDIGSWLPKLKATTAAATTTTTTTTSSSRGGGNPHRGRHAIEVEAASIMSVLKEFDVRFGREC